ncbi:MAG: hypothetical protein U0X73_17775 [Thermoanaerobaculia bacterium]
MRKTTRRTAAWIAPAVFLIAGCASKGRTEFTHPGADLGAIRSVAVLPFSTLTQDRTDAQKVQRVFLVELLALGAVDVVEPGEVAKLFAAEHLDSTDALAPADLQRIGKTLGANGLFLGTVVDFTETRTGSVPAPEVAIQLRLVETESGKTLWTSSQTRSGASAKARLFGFGGASLTETARRLMRQQLRHLAR